MKHSHFRPHLQSLEPRRLLAADAAVMDEVAAIFAADVNADGAVTARDALEVINELNANVAASQTPVEAEAAANEAGNRLRADRAAAVLERLDVNGDGRLSAVDALQIINRINSDRTDLAESVLRSLRDRGEDSSGERFTPLRETVRTAVEQLNTLRRESVLSRQAIRDAVGDIVGIVGDAERSPVDRTIAVIDRIETAIERGGVDAEVIDRIRARVNEVLESLPNSSISDFVEVYRETTADRSFSETELAELRDSAGKVLASVGIEGNLQDRLLDRFDRLIRWRF